LPIGAIPHALSLQSAFGNRQLAMICVIVPGPNTHVPRRN
jgi:hypothetical protein